MVESGENTVAAYNPEESCAVVVTINTSVDDQMWEFDISDLGMDISEISAIRTSGDIETGENWKDVSDSDDIRIDGQKFDALVKGASITTYIIK